MLTDPTDPNQISSEAWDANAEHWDARMGDEGNDFFKKNNPPQSPIVSRTIASIMDVSIYLK